MAVGVEVFDVRVKGKILVGNYESEQQQVTTNLILVLVALLTFPSVSILLYHTSYVDERAHTGTGIIPAVVRVCEHVYVRMHTAAAAAVVLYSIPCAHGYHS